MLRLPPQNKALATSCSHSNAICHHSFKKRIELRTQEQPLVAKHIGGTIRDRNDRSRNRRTDEVPFIAGCSHCTRKNTRFRAPASSQKQTLATSCSHSNAICNHPSSRSSLNRTPPFKVRSQSHTTLQDQVSIAQHPSRSTLNRAPPFKVKSQSHTALQDQVSIAQHPSRSSLNPICNDPSSRSCEVSHHPSRSTLNRAPPFKVKSQSHTTLQDQVSIAHHPSRSSLNRTPPFTPPFTPPLKVKCQSRTTLSQSRTTLQGQVSIANHPSRSSVNRAPPFIISRLRILFVRTSEVLLPNFL